MATIRDVAEAAGVSTATVSYVINGTKRISPETSQRVNDAIVALGYHVNAIAKSLKQRQTHRIAVIITDVCGQFFPYVIRGITNVAEAKGYSISLYNSHNSFQREQEYLEEIISNQFDGILLDSVLNTVHIPAYAEKLHRLFGNGVDKYIPITMMERDFSPCGFDSVCVNIYEGACSAVEHLWTMGCRNIAFISPPPTFDERIRAYQDVLAAHGVTPSPEWVEVGNFSHAAGYTCMKTILARGIRPDGVFSGNDEMAVGVYQALREAGLSIPGDVRVIGFDDIFLCSVLHPSLSSVHVEKEAMGTAAMQNLCQRVESGMQHPPVRIELPCHLVVRGSTDPDAVASHDWVTSTW